jgi:LmbE family N-acetylglucosaminyl deacetylase
MPAILCVFAHPDDEAFGPGGTIARYAAQGIPVDLLTFTRGQHGARPQHIDSPEALGLLREHELRAAVLVLGVRDLTLLDYVDGQLDQANADELAGHVVSQIERTQPDAMITFGPLGVTRHGDHVATHHAALAGARRSARPVRVFYQALEGEWVKRMNLDGPEAAPTHRIDVSDFMQTKLTALACHSSQDDAREFFMMLSGGAQREELYHQALPAFDGGPANDLLG